MGLQFQNLDAETRRFMLEEIELDVSNGSIYLSPWLTDTAKAEWPTLLKTAAAEGSDETLAADLGTDGRIHEMAERKKPKGGYTTYRVPATAPDTMAGEFNLFYIRALCRRAIADGIPRLEVYRARQSGEPRPESVALIGTLVDAAATLADLRETHGNTPKLGFPPGPNSGLSARLPRV